MKTVRLWAWLLALCGCAPRFVDTTVNGVPNLVQIAPRLYRMGQPENPAAWGWVDDTVIGVGGLHPGQSVTVVKLNDDAEGIDTPPDGWVLLKRPIPPEDDKPWTVVEMPDPKVVWGIVDEIVAAYMRGGIVIIHCTAGRDRTSLVSALAGMRLLGWSKTAAWQDMLRHGFRWELPDLDAFWLKDVR
jgi:hypothetical protein